MSDAEVLDLDQPDEDRRVWVHVAGHGELLLRGPTMRGLAPIREFRRNHHRGNARARVDALLACSVQPALLPDEVAAMPEFARAQLRRAVVDHIGMRKQWRALYGCHLSSDERLLVVTDLWMKAFLVDASRRLIESARPMVATISDLLPKHDRAATYQLPSPRLTSLAGRGVARRPAGIERLLSSGVERLFPARPVLSTGSAQSPGSILASLGGRGSGRVVGPERFLPPTPVVSTSPTVTALKTIFPSALGDREQRLRALAPAAGIASSRDWLGLGERARPAGLSARLSRRFDVPSGLAVTPHGGIGRTLRIAGAGEMGQALRIPGAGAIGEAVLASRASAALSAGLTLKAPRLNLDSFLGTGLRTEVERTLAGFREVARFLERYEEDRLWHVLSLAGIRVFRRLGQLEKAEVEQSLLNALEEVAADPVMSAIMEQLVDTMPYGTDSQRSHLRHGLEHLGQREFDRALPPLLLGFEGVLWCIAREQQIITASRMRLDRPGKEVSSVEALIKLLPWVTGELRRFIIRCIFGGEGNAYRHGDYEGGERERALWTFVALTALLDETTDQPVNEALGAQLEEELPAIIEPVRGRSAAA